MKPTGSKPAATKPAGPNAAGTKPTGSKPAGLNAAGTKPTGTKPAGPSAAGMTPTGFQTKSHVKFLKNFWKFLKLTVTLIAMQIHISFQTQKVTTNFYFA